MEFVTVGREFYPGLIVPMVYSCDLSIFYDQDAQNTYRILHIKDGFGLIKFNGTSVFISAPAICCLQTNDFLTFSQDAKLDSEILYFYPSIVSPRLDFTIMNKEEKDMLRDEWFFSPFSNRSDKYCGVFYINQNFSKHTTHLLKSLDNEVNVQRDSFWPCRSRSFFLELMALLCRAYMSSQEYEHSILNDVSNEIQPILEYLHTNYEKKITIDHLTNEFHTNKTTLNEKFKSTIGLTPIEYISKLRVQIACSMLRNTTVPISEIMVRVGFKDDAHFSRSFKKNVHMAPSIYRQQNNWMLQN